MAKASKPVVRSVTVVYSDSQDWRLAGGVIELRTHRGWVKIHYRSNRQLHRYLYGGWRLTDELKIKLDGKRVLLYLTFKRDFEVTYNPNNVIAVDVNENNVTLAVFKDGGLSDVYRIETNLGRIVIAYSERRKRITKGRSTRDREVRKALRKLRERERKMDIIYKTARIIEELALANNAVVVVGNVHRGKRRLINESGNKRLTHRIHQWSVATLVRVLSGKPIHVVEVSEAYTSSTDPFTGNRIKSFNPSVIRTAVRGVRRIRVVKIALRLTRLGNGLVLDRDVIGAINIGLKYLSTGGSPMALASTGPHEVRLKLMTPNQGPTPPTEIKAIKIH